MRWLYFLGIVLLFMHPVDAQKARTHFGLTVSTGLSLLNNRDDLFDGESKGGVSAGFNIYYRLSERRHLVSGVSWESVSVSGRDYTPQFGCDIDSMFMVDPFESYFEYRDKVHYLVIPVEFRYLISKDPAHAFYVQAGITNHFKLGISSRSLIIECEVPRPSGESFNPFYGMHVRGTVGFGYRAKLGKIVAFAQPVAQYSFNSIIKQFTKPHLLNLALRIGVEF